MKKTIIFVVIIVGLAVVVYVFSRGRSNDVSNSTVSVSPTVSVDPSVSSTITASPTASLVVTPTTTAVSDIKTFTIIGKSFSFTPNQITVNKGDTVKIIFQNIDGTHDWRLDEFNVRTSIIKSGKEETIQFVANKVGSFEYYCSIGAHRQMGMKGTLIVK